MAENLNQIEVLCVAKLSPFLLEPLQAHFQLHDRLHDTDPAAFAAVAPRIRAIAASGESKVSAELIERLPALQIISVMGVGYDGIDVAAAHARGVAVTHTPGVLNDDVADLFSLEVEALEGLEGFARVSAQALVLRKRCVT